MNADRQRIKTLEDELIAAITARDDALIARDAARQTLDVEIAKRIEAIDRWDVLFREMEGLASAFLTERDEERETIDEMRAEGCAAAGVLENIFNGVTAEGVNHSDPTIARVAMEASLALVSVPRCEHEAELKGLRELVWNYLDFTPGSRDNKCLTCGEQWYPNECMHTCLRSLLFKATKKAASTSIVWLELCDERDDAVEHAEEIRSLCEDVGERKPVGWDDRYELAQKMLALLPPSKEVPPDGE